MGAVRKVEKSGKRLATGVVELVEASLAFGEGVVGYFVLLTVFSWGLGIMILVGIGLAAIRYLFFSLIPVFIAFADPIVAIIDASIGILNVCVDAIIVIIDAVDEVLGTGTSPDFVDWPGLTISEFKSEMKFIWAECGPYDSAVRVWELAVTPRVSEEVCPYARAVYPVYQAKWAEGFVTADPDPYEGNCFIEQPSPRAAVCVGLASGFIVMEVLVPLFVVLLFLYAALKPLLKIAWSASSIVVYVAVAGAEAVAWSAEKLGLGVKDVALS